MRNNKPCYKFFYLDYLIFRDLFCRFQLKSLFIESGNVAIGKIDEKKLQRFLDLFALQYTVFEKEINKLLREEK